MSAAVPRLCAEERGSGRPLPLLHGIGGGKSSWQAAAELLAASRRVATPDLRGFGQSPWPDVAHTVDDHLATLQQLMDDRTSSLVRWTSRATCPSKARGG